MPGTVAFGAVNEVSAHLSPDWLAAWGSVVTGVAAIVAVFVTVWLAGRDRERTEGARNDDLARHNREMTVERDRAARDRADAERRFAVEVERSERQVRDERDYAENVRRREGRQASAAGLLGAIAGLMPYLDAVPNLYRDPEWKPGQQPAKETGPRWLECQEAVRSLWYAADVQAIGLGDDRAAEQVRTLVHLVQTAAAGMPADLRIRASYDLRRYALWVRVSLENLSNTGQSLDPGAPEVPVLTRMPPHDPPWHPSTGSEAWKLAVQREPGDPFYLPAN
jgi:hypothetical protein